MQVAFLFQHWLPVADILSWFNILIYLDMLAPQKTTLACKIDKHNADVQFIWISESYSAHVSI